MILLKLDVYRKNGGLPSFTYCCRSVSFRQSESADGTQTRAAATIIPPENKCRA